MKDVLKNMGREKQGESLLGEAKKMGVATDGIYNNAGRVREGALQQRIRNAKNTRYAQLTWLIALLSSIASVISAIAAWFAIIKN